MNRLLDIFKSGNILSNFEKYRENAQVDTDCINESYTRELVQICQQDSDYFIKQNEQYAHKRYIRTFFFC